MSISTNADLVTREWLEADGFGGFASGTSNGIRTRRYHALLLTATTPPTGRVVLVNGFDAWVETTSGTFSLSSQCYSPGVLGGDGPQHIEAFGSEPWPHWIYRLEEGLRIELEIFAVKGQRTTCLSWKLLGPRRDVKLHVRPFLSGRDYHSLHKSNPAFRFDAEVKTDRVCWSPYPDVPGVTALTNGSYTHDPHWYYNFVYEEERARGLDCEEDLAAPGVFSWNLADGNAALVLTTTENATALLPVNVKPMELLNKHREAEMKRRSRFPSRLHRAADAYVVERRTIPPHPSSGHPLPQWGRGRGEGDPTGSATKTIIAGYPWFTDWGRDTFIALRGLCLATGRVDVARDILLAWAGTVSEGMLPNRFPDQGGQPEFNSVDASLWFVIAMHEYLVAAGVSPAVEPGFQPGGRDAGDSNAPLRMVEGSGRQDAAFYGRQDACRHKLLTAVEAILTGYQTGTHFGIRADTDGLLACGVSGVQLTWMDAKVGDWVVTPRLGKPVEVQALWLNALWIASQHNDRWKEPLQRGLDSFRARFWNAERRMLYDVIDVDHQPGRVNGSFRPNQIFAVGGLPLRLVEDNRAFLIVEAVKDHLWTPLGLRSLAPGEPGYTPRYQGGVRERDGAYHQGTVWPWLLGAFVDAWTWVHKRTPAAIHEARREYLKPLLDHLETSGLGHISEIADADAPHTPRGCPWQAWSVGEALWLDQVVLREPEKANPSRTSVRRSSKVSTRELIAS